MEFPPQSNGKAFGQTMQRASDAERYSTQAWDRHAPSVSLPRRLSVGRAQGEER